MSLVYRFLGMLAVLNNMLAGMTFFLIPFNVIAVVGGGTLAGVILYEGRDEWLQSPQHPVAYILMGLLITTVLGLAFAILKRNTFFRSHGQPDHLLKFRPVVDEAPDMSATGDLLREDSRSGRSFFWNDPVFLTVVEGSGELVFRGGEQSSGWFGTSGKVIYYNQIIAHDSLRDLETGSLYIGFRRLPSVRFRFVHPARGKPQRLIISLKSDEMRDQLITLLMQVDHRDTVEPEAEASQTDDPEGGDDAQAVEPEADEARAGELNPSGDSTDDSQVAP